MYQRIKDTREDKDKTQKEIAKKLNCTQQTYSRYENGINEIPLERIAKLALIFDTSIDYLVGLTDEKKPYPKNKRIKFDI